MEAIFEFKFSGFVTCCFLSTFTSCLPFDENKTTTHSISRPDQALENLVVIMDNRLDTMGRMIKKQLGVLNQTLDRKFSAVDEKLDEHLQKFVALNRTFATFSNQVKQNYKESQMQAEKLQSDVSGVSSWQDWLWLTESNLSRSHIITRWVSYLLMKIFSFYRESLKKNSSLESSDQEEMLLDEAPKKPVVLL